MKRQRYRARATNEQIATRVLAIGLFIGGLIFVGWTIAIAFS